MASPFPCLIPFLRFSIRSPSRSFICLFFAFVSPLSRRACPEWLVPFPRLAVLPPFYSLVSLSLCLTVPFIHLFLRLSILCLSNSVWPERLLPFPRLAVLPHFYSLVSLSLFLTVPSFICSFASLSLAYRTVSGPNGFCLFLSPLLFRAFKLRLQAFVPCPAHFFFPVAVFRPWNDCNTLTGQ